MAEQPARLHDPASVARARQTLLPASTERMLRPLSDALCDPARFRIVQALSAAELSVKDLSSVIGRKESTTSQHLRVLRRIGAVEPRRFGRRIVYTLAGVGLGPALRRVLR